MAKLKQVSAEPGPELLHQISFSFAPSRVLTTAVELGVFSHLAEGKKTAEAVARAAKSSGRGMRMLMDALAALSLLTKDQTGYALTPFSAKYLVRTSPEYMGKMLQLLDLSDQWRSLTKAIRTGKPLRRLEQEKKGNDFFAVLVSGLHVINREPARRAAEVLGVGSWRKGLSAVDIACGSGVWGLAIAEADPAARITAQDFPAMLRETRKYIKRDGAADRFDYLPGDLNEVDYGKERYDLAILGNIVHSEGEKRSRKLFRNLWRALRPGGRIVIVDMIPNENRTAPPFPVFFALNMLLNTQDGDTYTLAQYAEWLMKAGFSRVDTADIGSHSPLIIGHKKPA